MKLLLLLCAFFIGSPAIGNAEPTISASLSAITTEVDQPVQLTLTIENARVSHPPMITADGLSINFAGTSTQTQIFNLKVRSKTTFTYIVTPTREGPIEIPSIPISIGNETYKTTPLMLQVVHRDNAPPENADELFFGELVIPKKSAYVGEQIPIELRFYFDRHINYEPYPQGQFPLIDGEGFIIKKYPDPVDRQLSVNGKTYQTQVYKTALTGVKPGKLELVSASQQFRIAFGFSSGANPNFGGPFQNYQEQVVTVKTNGASIEIKPLPIAGKPPNFSGTVGDFTLTASAVPVTTKVGDPIAMKVEIKGFGNFDRMDTPTLSDRDAWRVYDPSSETTPLDDIGLSATKTFNFPIVPEKKISNLPTAEFSYFDPNTEKYVTLKSSPLAVTVEDQPQLTVSPTPAPSLATGASSATSSITPSTVAPTPEPDILDIRLGAPSEPASFRSFRSWIDEPIFWIVQAVPALILLLIVVGFWIRNTWVASRPIRSLLQEQRLLEKQLNSANQSSELLSTTIRLLELHLRLSLKQGTTQSVESTLARPDLPESIRSEVEQLLQRRMQVAYGGLGSESVTQEQRLQTKNLIQRWKTMT